jgi:adenylyl cyclase-associated protein
MCSLQKKLTPGTYTALESSFYCKPHYTQLFTQKGNYSEGFGKEKPTAAWTPQVVGYEGVDLSKKGEEKKDEKPAAAQTKASTPAQTKTSTPAPAQTKAAGGAPPPPSGGPPPPAAGPPPVDAGEAGGANAQAAALDAIRSGGHKLKHVSREERKQKPVSSVVPGETKKKETVARAEPTQAKAGPPELKLENHKWTVRFQQGKEEPFTIAITDMKQSVNILDCKKVSVIIQGKVTNISVVNCSEVGVIFDDVIATVEAVRSNKLGIQANGKIQQIAIDKCSGVDVFIQSKEGSTVEIVTSLSDSLNVNFPGATPDDDPIEFPIPSQFTSAIVKEKLITHPVEHV